MRRCHPIKIISTLVNKIQEMYVHKAQIEMNAMEKITKGKKNYIEDRLRVLSKNM